MKLPNHDGIVCGDIYIEKASVAMSLTVEKMLRDIAASKNCCSNIADNELMLWSEEAIADALRYAADCVALVDAMPENEGSGEEG